MTKLNTGGSRASRTNCVKIEKNALQSFFLRCDQLSPFSSPSPFFSGDALPLFDPLDWDLLESPFSFAGDRDRDLESLLDFLASLSLLSPLLGDLFVFDLDRDLDLDLDLDFDLLLRLRDLDFDLDVFFPLRLRDLDLDLESLLLDLERDLDLRDLDLDLERRERDLLLLLLLLLDLDLDFLPPPPPPLLSSVNLIRRPLRS